MRPTNLSSAAEADPAPDQFRRSPRVQVTNVLPAWAGDLAETLLRDSERLIHRGRTRVGGWDADPMTILNSWAAHPRVRGKRVIGSVWGLRMRFHRPWSTYRLKPGSPSEGVVAGYSADGRTVRTVQVADLTAEILSAAHPMREFSRRLTQEHKPVAVWTHTTGSLIGAESHLERDFITLADFHPAVRYIGGQPFTLAFEPGALCKLHTPDLVLLGDGLPPLVVDVKNAEQASTPKWRARASLIRDVLAEAGIGYEVWTGMPRLMQANLENFTEARVPEPSYLRWAPVAAELCSRPMPVVELVTRIAARGYEPGFAMMLIRRMLWRRDLRTDMRLPFRSTSIVWTVAS